MQDAISGRPGGQRLDQRERARRAAVVGSLVRYNLGVAAVGVATVWLLSGSLLVYLAIYALFIAFTLAAYALYRRESHVAASYMLLLSMFAPATLGAVAMGGVESGAMMAYPVIIFAAGLIASTGAAIATAVVSSIAILAIATCEARGWLPPQPANTPLDAWISFSLVAIFAIAVLTVALRGIRASIEDSERSERELRESIEQSPDGILSLGEDLRIAAANRAAEAILGRSRAELVGAPLSTSGWLAQGDRGNLEVMLSRVRGGEAAGPRELTFSRPDGSTAIAEINARRVRHEHGRAAVQITLRDVTERRRLEREKSALELERQHAQRLEAMGKLAGGVAHDFNNYLTVILGCCELLEARLPRESEELSAVRNIASAAVRSTQLTRQLLAFSRRQPLEPSIVCVNELIRSLEPMLARLLGEQVRIHIVTRGEPSRVFVDPGQIEVALINLAVNARDAMPSGGALTLETDRIDLPPAAAAALGLRAGPHLCVAVADTGSGIDELIQDHIFEPFFTTKGRGQGSGIGLATVYGIVRQSGGAIRFESEPGRGTRFEILLPARDEAGEAPRLPPQRAEGGGHGRRILLVEDEQDVRNVVRSMLESRGYVVVEAEDGRAALSRIEAGGEPIDAVLTDVVMPELGGAELCERLERIAPELPLVLMSGYPEDQLGKLERRGEHPLLAKPFSLDQLEAALETALGGRGAAEGAPDGAPRPPR